MPSHALGLKVVAEGVESEVILARLQLGQADSSVHCLTHSAPTAPTPPRTRLTPYEFFVAVLFPDPKTGGGDAAESV